MNTQGEQTETHPHRGQCGGHRREGGRGAVKGEEGQVSGDGRRGKPWALGRVQCTGHVSEKRALETDILLTDVNKLNSPPINLI